MAPVGVLDKYEKYLLELDIWRISGVLAVWNSKAECFIGAQGNIWDYFMGTKQPEYLVHDGTGVLKNIMSVYYNFIKLKKQ